jgi:hypothetical protein
MTEPHSPRRASCGVAVRGRVNEGLILVAALPQKLVQGDAVIVRRGGLRSGLRGRNPTLPEIPRWPPGT